MTFKWIHYTSSEDRPQYLLLYDREKASAKTIFDEISSLPYIERPSYSVLLQIVLVLTDSPTQKQRGQELGGVLLQTSKYQTQHLTKINPQQIAACNPIIHLSQYRLLFCTLCLSAIPAKKLRSHLFICHQLPASLREPII